MKNINDKKLTKVCGSENECVNTTFFFGVDNIQFIKDVKVQIVMVDLRNKV